jgi:NAD-dependent dihydropyrimidine dehydrogenase PreA subunit
MKREIVKIDEEKCTGCGLCIPNCHEGALQIIDGKAVLISDLMCDGLGACLGHCPEGALEIETREAEAYDEPKVMAEMVKKTKNVVIAHLMHLKDHNEIEYLRQGLGYLTANSASIPHNTDEIIYTLEQYIPTNNKHEHKSEKQPSMNIQAMHPQGGGCPGSQSKSFKPVSISQVSTSEIPSALAQWPVQMHLINPGASHFQNSDFVLAADCVAYALGGFHSKYLQGKTLGIACPKLDTNKEVYLEKLVRLIDESKVNTIAVLIMEVPCCGGLLQLAMNASQRAVRKVPVKAVTVGVQGEILSEEWV